MKRKLHMFLREPGLLLGFVMTLLSFTSSFAQTVKVEGTVKDAQGALPGVSVVAKGTTTGTITDGEGNYKLDVDKNAVLVFTFIGYTANEVALAGRQPSTGGIYKIDVTLVNNDNNLDEVVVVGFGTQKKVNLTGAVATIDSKAIENRPVRNASQALQGLVTGLNIAQNNGSLESNPSINIRGVGSIGNSSSSPLILVDGMEGSLNAINPQDIENISVLKDAAAAAVYGSRAAFGVILITTKRGKSGKLQLNYNNSFRSSSPVLMPRMMDSYTFALYFNDAGTNGGSAPHFSAAHLQRILDYKNGVTTATTIIDPNDNTKSRWADGYAAGNDNVDWYKAMFRERSLSQEHNFSLSGGNEKTQVYLSGNYMGQQGMMKFNQDDFARYGFTAKINSQLTDQVAVNYSTRFIREDYNRPSQLTNNFYQDLGRQGWPTLPLYDPNGFLFSSPSPALAMRDGGKDRSQKDYLYQQLQLVFEPVKGWKTFAEINYRTRNDFRHWDVQRTYNHDVAGNPILYGRNSEVYEYGYKENYFNANVYSEYSKTIAQKHFFKIMGGFQTELTKYKDLSALRNGIIVPALPTIATTGGIDANGLPVPPTVSGIYHRWATAGFFGRLNYDYDGKYLFEGNLRYDGSSRFRADQRWNLFPSVSVGWNMAREKVWEDNLSFINTMKLRASYGQLGNQKPADNTADFYPTYVTMPVNTANGAWLIDGLRPNTASAPGLVSSDLTWETIKSYDIGLDWGLLNNRLTGSFDWFLRKTANMVGPAPVLPVILGTAVPRLNNTDLKTSGFEFEVSYKDQTKAGLGYGVRLLLSDYQTTITKYPNPTLSLATDLYRTGQKMGEIWGYETIGIAKSQEEMDAHLATLTNGGQTSLGSMWSAGDIMYKDLNGDGRIDEGSNTQNNPGDKKLIGNSTPRYTIGMDINLDWKGFDFRGFLQGVLKRDYWQGSYFFWGATNNMWWSTGLVDHADYFRNDPNHPLGVNTDAYYPRPLFNSDKNQRTQSGYLQDASYIRLKNIQLGYTIPATITKKLAIQKLRVYVSGENVFTRTKVAKMFDPETIDGGSGGSVYPLSKVYAAGLSVTF